MANDADRSDIHQLDSRDQAGRRRIRVSRSKTAADHLVARFAPDATGEAQVEALRRLEQFVATLIRIATRLEREGSTDPPSRPN
ncbi:MAG TPA: hypothetical protein VL358_06515 [Caulobacteraceae bacterium]|jgi:hypothetical protein|nr:hypothetical protein [Caulobacteraceae bacterium]